MKKTNNQLQKQLLKIYPNPIKAKGLAAKLVKVNLLEKWQDESGLEDNDFLMAVSWCIWGRWLLTARANFSSSSFSSPANFY